MNAPPPLRQRDILGVVAIGSALWLAAFAIGMRQGAPLMGLAAVSLLVLVFVGRTTSRRLRLAPSSFGLPPAAPMTPLRASLIVGAGVGAVTLAATYLLWPVVRAVLPASVEDARRLYQAIPVTPATVPLVMLVVLAEEVLWRGCLVTPRVSEGKRLLGIAVASTSMYALAQAGSGIALLGLGGVALGAVWAAEAILTRSLMAPLVSHMMWTLSVFWWAPLPV